MIRHTHRCLAPQLQRRIEPLAGVVMLIMALTSCRSNLPIESTQQLATLSPSSLTIPMPTRADPTCALSEGWSLTYTVSGGLAGTTNTLSVSDSGEARFSSSRPPTQSRGTISAPQIDELQQALETACAAERGSGRSKPCPDCLEYRVVLTSSNGTTVWSSLSGDDLSPAIDSLFGHLDRLADRFRSP